MDDYGASLCWRLKLPVEHKLVFMRLVFAAGEGFPLVCPSIQEISADCQVAPRAVEFMIRHFVNIGVMKQYGSCHYAFEVDRIEDLAGPLPPERVRKPTIPSLRLTGTAWLAMRASVFERDGFACTYCGDADGPLHCDHVVPVSRGGTNDIDNLATACFRCNCSKGAKLLSEWECRPAHTDSMQ